MEKRNLEKSFRIMSKKKSTIALSRLRRNFSFCCIAKDKSGKNDEIDTITFSRKKSLNEKMIKEFEKIEEYNENMNIEAGISIECSNIEKISDDEFKIECFKAADKCRHIVYIFFTLEKTAFLFETICSIFPVIVASYELSVYQILGFVIFFVIFSIVSSFGDWGALREKYSRIRKYFLNLSDSKEDDRSELFLKYAKSYSGDGLFIDLIIFNEEKN